MTDSTLAPLATLLPGKVRDVEHFRSKNWSVSAIARHLGVPEKAVADHLGIPWGLSPSTVIRRRELTP